MNKDLLKELKAALSDGVKPITEALARFAERPADVSDDLDATAERCMAPLKNLLARYRTLEEQIATAVETTEKERLAIQYGRAVTQSHTARTLLRFRLNPRDNDGKTLYRKMLTGDFADAMTAGMDDENDAITLESCVFQTHVRTQGHFQTHIQRFRDVKSPLAAPCQQNSRSSRASADKSISSRPRAKFPMSTLPSANASRCASAA